MSEEALSCVEPTAGPITPSAPEKQSGQEQKEVQMTIARVGKEAPDFEARAFVDGAFKNVKLSDYRGQWVVVCFYPGDFTFV
jgi:hypothetical protein